MLRTLNCRWCIVVGLCLLFYSAVLYAQPEILDRHDVPTWEILVPYVFGSVLAIVVAYARGLSSRITDIARDIETKKADSNNQIAALKERMLTQYHDSAEIERVIQSAIAPIQTQLTYMNRELAKVDSIHIRLDKLNVPRAHE